MTLVVKDMLCCSKFLAGRHHMTLDHQFSSRCCQATVMRLPLPPESQSTQHYRLPTPRGIPTRVNQTHRWHISDISSSLFGLW